MTFHPLSDLFPLMPEPELRALADDIKTNGLKYPICLYEGKILDGRNRYRACQLAKVKPEFQDYKDSEPLAHVVSLNLARRHLNESQRAMVAARLANLPDGVRKDRSANLPTLAVSQPEAAKLLNVSERSLRTAKSLLESEPELAKQVELGVLPVSKAMRRVQKKKQAAKIKAARRRKPEIPKGPFDLVLADPPWKYEHCEADNREIENQYPTATLDEIKSQKPESASNSVLFLWATAPKVEEALQVMREWGFNYRTCAVWDKTVIGMGYWFRIQHELLLVGIKGKPTCTPECERISSLFAEKRRGHSEKPECVYQWIERAFPEAKKLEMYARRIRPGWAATGNEL